MTKAYSYARFSSRAQAEGDSLRRQLAAAYAFAEEHGLELDLSLQDKGVSAFNGANRTKGALKSFLDRVENGDVEQGSFLLIDSMDRLSRETVTEATYQLLGIALAGVNVVTLNDGRVFDRDASMADMMFALMEIDRSHKESLEKGRKVAEAHAESKRRAREEGRVWHRSGPTWLRFDEDAKRFEHIPEKVAVVRRVFDLIEGGLGTTAIAVRFNDEGVPTPRNGAGGWHHSAVLEIAKNRAVIGEYQPKLAKGGNRASRRPADGDPIPGYYGEPVIPVDQFHRVQAILKGRAPRRGRGANTKEFTNILIGLCRCNGCGGTVGMHTAARHDRWARSSVLRCVNSTRGRCLSKRRFKYEPIERAVIRYVSELTLPNENKSTGIVSEIATARAERDDIAAKVENLLQVLEGGDAGILTRYRERVAELEAKDAEIRVLGDTLKQAAAARPLRSRQEAVQALYERMQSAEGEELYSLRAALAAALRGIVWWIEFYGGLDEVGPDKFVQEDYAIVRMLGDERMYLIAPDQIIISDLIERQDERFFFDDETVTQPHKVA